jgi:hypothetical protein
VTKNPQSESLDGLPESLPCGGRPSSTLPSVDFPDPVTPIKQIRFSFGSTGEECPESASILKKCTSGKIRDHRSRLLKILEREKQKCKGSQTYKKKTDGAVK